MKKTYISLFILLLEMYSSYASNVIIGNQKIEKFVSEQGFFQNTILAITSDDIGYLWIATPNGLVRYDGYSFEYFYHDFSNPKSIPGNKIKNLLSDSEGKLWIGTDQGICIYIVDREQFISLNSEIKNVSFLKDDFNGKVWTGKGSSLYVFDLGDQLLDLQKQAVEINFSKELDGERIVDIEFLNDSVLLLATSSAIYKLTYNETKNYDYTLKNLLFDYQGTGIGKIIKRDNTIWVGTDNGIYQTLPEINHLTTIRHFFYANDQKQDNSINVLTLFSDKEKNLWIGTKRNGILKYDSNIEGFVSYKFDSKNVFGINSNRINCFYEDEFGVIWIGTAQGGLNKLDKNQKPFQNYTHNPYDNKSLSSNLPTNLVEDKEGRIWISFFDNIICRTNNEIDITEGHRIKFDRLEKQFGELKNNIVVKLFQDSKGFWWIGTQEGLYFYDELNENLMQVNLKSHNVDFCSLGNRVIEQISPNQILIGGRQVYLLDDPWKWILNGKAVPVDTVLLDLGKYNSLNDFKEDVFGNLWFATQNGIYHVIRKGERYDLSKRLKNSGVNNKLKLSHKWIFCIHESADRNLWIGSFGGGLMKIQLNSTGEPENIKTYHKEDGLPDEVIYGILEDNSGKLWMSTDMGICRFDPVTEIFEVFDVNDRILNNNFRQASFLKTKSGLMLMGGLNGLTIFNPEHITKNEICPTVIISKLNINNHHIIAGERVNNKIILEKSITDTKKLVLDHRNRNISLDIIVQHNSAPNKNRLSYMLEGVNDNWIEIHGGKTTATYTNLNPGTYRFLYKGANSDGIWAKNTGELIIQILAPWYLRWWSLLLWGVVILLLGYGIFRDLVRLEKLKQKLKFEQLDKERMHEMDQAKLRFFTNITHDFKTPLTLIIGPLEKISEKYKQKEDEKYFTIIENNISRLHRLIDQLISYRKAESGHLELNYTKISLGNFVYPLLESFEEYAKSTNVNFYYKVNAPIRQVSIDIDNTERILLNLFSNAIKFTEQGGEISVEAGFRETESKDILYFEVKDNGIGIPKTHIDKIFERFYRGVEDCGNWSGTGIGLALCKSLIELMNGNISVESILGKKTVFKIELPFDVVVKPDTGKDLMKPGRIVNDWMPVELNESKDIFFDSMRPSLLIIDDEKDVRLLLQESLKDKYNIILAVDGEDGWDKLGENKPQLVISDVMMPKMNGYLFCEKIKLNPETCHIPIILLTALDDDSRMIEGLEFGADDYITKPFSLKHIETRVKQLIENKQRLIEYFSKYSVIPEEDLSMTEKDRSFLETIISLIENNLADSSFGVEELAKAAGMSTSHLYRRLKQLTGQVPNVYIRNLRLQKAAGLLKLNKSITAIEVMYEIGIESPSYFSTSFKKMYGASPIEFQKRN
jgi:signal transduction histidine kinase/ligand-binding sensor domain-containing protein/DNA-binding response OmpR family regulator